MLLRSAHSIVRSAHNVVSSPGRSSRSVGRTLPESNSSGAPAAPDGPFHRPPIKPNPPAPTENTQPPKSFHAPLPKAHRSSGSLPRARKTVWSQGLKWRPTTASRSRSAPRRSRDTRSSVLSMVATTSSASGGRSDRLPPQKARQLQGLPRDRPGCRLPL
jgi:hypothetical protein